MGVWPARRTANVGPVTPSTTAPLPQRLLVNFPPQPLAPPNSLLSHYPPLSPLFYIVSSGRILNRFSRDTDIMDVTLSLSLNQFSNCLAILICNLVVIAITTKCVVGVGAVWAVWGVWNIG